ncbi:Spy/CpxP family protein refolding chaperone [Neisseria chenwenguii]|uniref:Uncharacterized protein n=1 Tax=Neisseria chenwenguii TaxID=1853278 RepID=A0A220RZ52_9NEIS|nr:Spy/CpxP family protein refolding chaperone [Neisseria chenwenguii]ASK26490.1 hypothetical protein BG910_00880 [Neisseria chenwenguii]ROV55932.1 hypothetical protein EGS38_07000 [Neisseria chenwenguii]
MLIRYIQPRAEYQENNKVSAASKSRLTAVFLLPLLFAAGSGTVSAAPNTLDDFYPNCDIRQLNLSQSQHNALRRIRSDYRAATEKAYRKAQRTDRTRRQNIMRILSDDSFDQNRARDYVEDRYLSSMDFAVDELSIQYRFYHLLTPQQRQIWISSCVR